MVVTVLWTLHEKPKKGRNEKRFHCTRGTHTLLIILKKKKIIFIHFIIEILLYCKACHVQLRVHTAHF